MKFISNVSCSFATRDKKIIVSYIYILCWRIMASKVFLTRIGYAMNLARITLKARSWLLLKLTSISSVHRNRSWPVRGHVTKNRTLVRRKADTSCISKIISLIYLPKLSKSHFNNSHVIIIILAYISSLPVCFLI